LFFGKEPKSKVAEPEQIADEPEMEAMYPASLAAE
jgi:hypothetical protein